MSQHGNFQIRLYMKPLYPAVSSPLLAAQKIRTLQKTTPMDENTPTTKPQILVVPYPAQGHINPAVAFAKHLSSRGILVTLIITTNLSKTAKVTASDSIQIDFVSDGSEHVDGAESIEAYFNRFTAVFSRNFAKFLDDRAIPPRAVIYDSTMPWILDIAHERGIIGALFFTQCCAVNAVFYAVKEGRLGFPYEEEDGAVALPGLPPLEKKDLPSLSVFMDENRTVVKLLANQWSNIERVDWIFANTFDALENEILEWMKSRCAIKTIGPTILLPAKDDELSDKNYTISLFDPKHDLCREWLNRRETASVAYVSFGSIASLGNEQMEELAFGLIMSDCYFLWVVRSSEVDKLPPDFTSLASEKGLIVEWCHQQEVLAHRAIACFMTHCGWNSTLEGLSQGVPLIAMAQWADQTTNAKFIEDVWRNGVGVKGRENGIIGREEIAECIREVVNGDKGIELKENAGKLKKLANEAVQKGGTSANNIDDFVSKLVGDDKVQ